VIRDSPSLAGSEGDRAFCLKEDCRKRDGPRQCDGSADGKNRFPHKLVLVRRRAAIGEIFHAGRAGRLRVKQERFSTRENVLGSNPRPMTSEHRDAFVEKPESAATSILPKMQTKARNQSTS
jgi:hypothetical protein